MFAQLLLGLLILTGIIFLLRAFASESPASLARAVRRAAILSAAVGAVLLLLRVPLGFSLLGVGAVLPLTLRWRALWPAFASASNQPSGTASRIETKHLRMALDLETGTLDGLVLAGRHRDSLLSKLTLEQILEVREECLAGDPEGVPLIEAYLDRIHGSRWRGRSSDQGGHARAKYPSGAMSREEALQVLGLGPGASDADIREAYHKLIRKLHPDHGGSDYLAAKVNQARDVLIGT